MVPVCVDGSNDGSVDYHLYNGLNKSRIVVQTTDNWQNLERKIKGNMSDVAGRADIDIYYMMVKEVVSNDVKERLEQQALDKHHLMMKILGANEVSSFILRYDLIDDLFRLSHTVSDEPSGKRIQQPEVMLHMYLSMSSDSRDLNQEMIDSTLRFILFNKPQQGRQELANEVLQYLRLPELRQLDVVGRIESLRSKGVFDECEGQLDLSSAARKEIDQLVGDYDAELSLFSDICVSTIKEIAGRDFAISNQKEFATLLARCYVSCYLDVVKRSDYELDSEIFASPVLNSPLTQIKSMLLKDGIAQHKLDECVNTLVLRASGNSLVKRLAQSVVYVAIRDYSSRNSPAVFNTDNWGSVSVYVDAAALMPFLVSSLFEQGRFARNETCLAISTIQKTRCKLLVPFDYVDEASSHLIAARWYCENEEGFEADFEFVPNAYVSSYYKMKKCGIEVPDTLREYLSLFCEDLFKFDSSQYSYKSVVRASISTLARYYGVEMTEFKDALDEQDIAYCDEWKEFLKKKKTDWRLIRHDASVLSHIYHKGRTQLGRNVLVTWDNSLLRADRTLRRDIWIVTPVDMADLVSVSFNDENYDLMALSHAVASVTTSSKEMAYGHILEKIMLMCKDKKMDWKCRLEIQRIRDEFFSYCDSNDSKDCSIESEECEKRTMEILDKSGFSEEESGVELTGGESQDINE